ncbi:MAG: hypothetical protein LBH92_01800 [Bacteroidales bacterium]|jgi:tetratricopeptide (TPR) repeat protein|nr:hypothetical protein [Bacteroidales bacterium]
MTRKNLSDIINYCEVPQETLLPQLEQIVAKYPYCQTLWILLAAGWAVYDNLKFQQSLPKIATIITNRRQLKNIVSLATNKEPLLPKKNIEIVDFELIQDEVKKDIIVEPVIVQEVSPNNDFLELLIAQLEDIEEEIINFTKGNNTVVTTEEKTEDLSHEVVEKYTESVEFSAEPSHQIEKETQEEKILASNYDLYKTNEENAPEEVKKDSSIEEKMKLIDQFLEKLPTISRATGEFFNPEEMIEKSIDDDELPVSETLATILVQQGKYSEAIEIYKKLILENPKKSSYFATQIKNLSNI